MAVTQTYISSKKTLLELQSIHDQISSISAVLSKIDSFVTSGILAISDANDLKTSLKTTIQDLVNSKVSLLSAEAIIDSLASEAEVNNKIQGMAPVIAGVPVIIPAPAVAGADSIALVALGVTAASDLVTMLNDIAQVTQ